MPVTSVTTDTDALTMTVVAEFPVPVERLWRAFVDPRQLERFWGPPGFPATVDRFELRPGGTAHYWMTSPEGTQFHGRWEFVEIDEPHRLVINDSFAHADGSIDSTFPTGRMTLTFERTPNGSRVTTTSASPTLEALEKVIAMGQAEGMQQAYDQLDTVLADLRASALGRGIRTEILDDTLVRITRAFDAPRHLIWRAHTETALQRRWLLGPDGWHMTVCENELRAGGAYRTAWAPDEGTPGEPFGFEGENLLIEPERRIVQTERMSGVDGPGTTNDLTLDEENGVTLLTLLITYPSIELRDMILGTGMTDGMETSYQRLEREVLPGM